MYGLKTDQKEQTNLLVSDHNWNEDSSSWLINLYFHNQLTYVY